VCPDGHCLKDSQVIAPAPTIIGRLEGLAGVRREVMATAMHIVRSLPWPCTPEAALHTFGPVGMRLRGKEMRE